MQNKNCRDKSINSINKYKAVLFDLDGTLLYTLEDLAFSVNTVLKKHSLPTHPTDAYKAFIGDGILQLVSRALPENKRTPDLIKMLISEAKPFYEQNALKTTRPYDGIPELLDALESRNIRMAILSNKPHELTAFIVSKIFAKWKFDIVWGERPQMPPKPDPKGAIELAKQLEIPPNEFLYLGDMATDIKTACGAGMNAVGVLWGFRDKKELADAGAKIFISHPLELLNLL